jgi:hypothetical protein
MGRGLRRVPVLVIAGAALAIALGGTVYAAGKINGRTIKVKSLPGNRLAIGSVPGNRLKPGAIQGSALAPGSITGIQIDASTLGQVPAAIHADVAESARDAETALNAANAENARTVNGYEAGCKTGTRAFAGACWQLGANATALSAPAAAAACAVQGGELPEALALVAFSHQPGVTLSGDEWSADLTNVSGVDLYAAITVSPAGTVSSAISTATKKFRCVLPLVG